MNKNGDGDKNGDVLMPEKKRIRDVEEMPGYQLLYRLALRIEMETRGFPADFRWLRNQVLRSSGSVFANMREGFYSQYSTEYLQSLYRRRREAEETVGHTKYARDVGVVPAETADQLVAEYKDALGQTAGLISSIERKIATRGKGKPARVRESGTSHGIAAGEDLV